MRILYLLPDCCERQCLLRVRAVSPALGHFPSRWAVPLSSLPFLSCFCLSNGKGKGATEQVSRGSRETLPHNKTTERAGNVAWRKDIYLAMIGSRFNSHPGETKRPQYALHLLTTFSLLSRHIFILVTSYSGSVRAKVGFDNMFEWQNYLQVNCTYYTIISPELVSPGFG